MFIPRYPFHVVIIVTERCNLECSHCSSSSSSKTARTLACEDIKRVLDQLAAAGVVDVAFSGGEPLLHPSIIELIGYAATLGLKCGISTNGYTLTERRIAELRGSGLTRLQVSLDGNERQHDRIRGDGAYARATAAICQSVASGLQTHVCFTAMRENFHGLDQVIQTAIELGAKGINLSKLVPTGRGSLSACLSAEQAAAVHGRYIHYKKRFPHIRFTSHLSGLCLYDESVSADAGFIGCHAGIYIASVQVDGSVTPCVLFPLVVGNLFDSSFRDIWDRAPEIRALKSRTVKGACGSCGQVQRCGGCRSTAMAIGGDYLAEDPFCPLVATSYPT